MSAAASSSSSSGKNAKSLPAFQLEVGRPQPASIYSAKFDTSALIQAHPPSGFKSKNKQEVWKLIQSRSSSSSSKPRPLRYTRVDSSKIIPPLSNLFECKTEVEFAKSVYNYESSSAGGETVWWVNFADKHLFGFYASPLFAQDEWMCAEHPSLCSLRDYLHHRSSFDTKAKPLTVSPMGSSGTQPTPCIVMNAPREVNIDAVRGDLYGHKFDKASKSAVLASTKLLSPPTLSNIIAMEALKKGRGEYSAKQIALTIQTAVGAFTAARLESAIENQDQKHYITEPAIVIHSGNWGCGAFGGNVTLMCILQVISARLSGISKLVYHVLDASSEAECKTALRTVDNLLQQLSKDIETKGEQNVSLQDLIASIEKLKFQWGKANGT